MIHNGDCLEIMRGMDASSVDAIVTDPPYPEIDRAYGRMTEGDWLVMMKAVVQESRRVLKPRGSAVFILQPNSEKVGRMRPWLWDFMAWAAREWGIVQDAYWWNFAVLPTVGCQRTVGLMRGSVKPCVWIGGADCWRDQDAVLWTESDANKAKAKGSMALHRLPSGHSVRYGRCASVAAERGGTTPFNLIPMANSSSVGSSGAHGHGAGTPLALMRWWTRYICPPAGTVLDPFMGAGTLALAAIAEGREYVGIEKMPEYVEIARARIAHAVLHSEHTDHFADANKMPSAKSRASADYTPDMFGGSPFS